MGGGKGALRLRPTATIDAMPQVLVRRALPALLAAAGALACASPAPPPAAPPPTSGPAVRCRTVLEVRPGAYGTGSNATPVQRCDPELPASAPEAAPDDEKPLGAH